MVVFDSLPPPCATNRDIYGRLWDRRTPCYLPVVMHQ
jgi:hypothetical protein